MVLGFRPIGQTRVAVVDEALRPVGDDRPGELLLGGPQLAPGYWQDPERTAESFVTAPELDPAGPWYRTGDRVSRSREWSRESNRRCTRSRNSEGSFPRAPSDAAACGRDAAHSSAIRTSAVA